MANSIMATDSSFTNATIGTIKNDTLRVRTQQLYNDGMALQRARRAIAFNLVSIHKEAAILCREFDGKDSEAKFDTYGEKILGLKRAQLRALVRVGEKFIKSDYDSVLQLASGDDFTTTQLQAIAPIGVPVAKQLVADGELAPTMTVKEIKEVVFAHDKKAQERKAKRGSKAAKAAKGDKTKQETQVTKLFALEVVQHDDKSMHVLINGVDVTATKDKEVKRIVTYIIKNSKYITK